MLGIRGKVLLISTSLVVLGIAVSTFLNSRAFRKEYSDSLRSEVTVVAQNLRSELNRIRSLGLDIDDIRGFEKQCGDVKLRHLSVGYAMVVRGDGMVFFHNDPALQGKVLETLAWLQSVDQTHPSFHTSIDVSGEEFYDVAVPCDPDDKGSVFVIVGFPSRLIDAKVNALVAKSALFAGTAILVAAGLLLASISASVTRPLSVLLKTMREIRTSGDLNKTVAVRSKDEIGTLAMSFNDMLGSLRQARDELEDRVKERTKELTKANQDLKGEIAERMRVAEALRGSEERYRLVAERTGQIVYDHNVATGAIQWCGAVKAVTGCSPEEFTKIDADGWIEMIHPDDRPRVMEALQQALKHGTSFEEPYRFRCKDGHYMYTEDSAVVLRTAKGEPSRVLGTMKDITQRKLAEEELKRSHELLEQRVEERTRELVQANNQIRQAQADLVQAEKMGMLGQLVAGVAHEINTPTGAIMNVANDASTHLRELTASAMKMSQLPPELRDWLAKELPNVLSRKVAFADMTGREVRQAVEQELRRQGIPNVRRVAEVLIDCGLSGSDPIAVKCLSDEAGLTFMESMIALKVGADISLTSVQKITRIVKALRYYSRSGDGELFNINLAESIDNTLVILQNRIKTVAKVERHYADDVPTVRCGPDVSQVWTNIICNACDAIESSDAKNRGLINITTRMADQQAVIEIYNVGPPIPENVLGKIFDPFFTTKPIGKGTGLGLSICTGILRKYNGIIAARNDSGGVTFVVALPLIKAESANGQPTRPDGKAQTAGQVA